MKKENLRQQKALDEKNARRKLRKEMKARAKEQKGKTESETILQKQKFMNIRSWKDNYGTGEGAELRRHSKQAASSAMHSVAMRDPDLKNIIHEGRTISPSDEDTINNAMHVAMKCSFDECSKDTVNFIPPPPPPTDMATVHSIERCDPQPSKVFNPPDDIMDTQPHNSQNNHTRGYSPPHTSTDKDTPKIESHVVPSPFVLKSPPADESEKVVSKNISISTLAPKSLLNQIQLGTTLKKNIVRSFACSIRYILN